MSLVKKISLSALLSALILMVFCAVAWAAEGEAGLDPDVKKYLAIAGGFGIAVAAFGGALAQGRAATAALSGIARNPGAADKMFTPMILALALIESLVIYALIISFMLVGKIGG